MMQQAFLDGKPARVPTPAMTLALNIAVAIAYAASGYAGLKLAFVGQAVTLFWPPSGIAFAAVWLFGFRLLPGLVAGAFAVNLVALGAPVPAGLVAIGNMLPAIAATLVLRSMLARHPQAGEFWRVFRFITVAALGATMLSATVGTLVLTLVRNVSVDAGSAWIIWWMGDAMGVLIVAPPILMWRRMVGQPPRWRSLADALAFGAAGLGIIAGLMFVREPIWAVELCKLFTLLLSLWAATRFGVAGPAAITLLMAVGAVAVTVFGVGPFARQSFFDSFALVHSYLFVTSITGMLLAGALTDLRRIARAERIARAAAETAAANRVRLLSMISHDVRTPLAGMMGVLQALDRDALDDRQSRLVGLGLRAGGTLTTLVTDILDVARADAGRITLAPAPFDPSQSIGDILDINRAAATAKGLCLESSGLDTLPRVIGDRARFEQVIGNLVANAVAYTATGRVAVWASWTPQAPLPLAITIADTGPGIDPERLATVFDAFALEPRPGNRSAGLGLGLHICRRLVDLMQGTIGCQPAPGGGSLFHIALPLPAAAAQPAAPVPAEDPPLKVLLVEDDGITAEVTTALLASHGHQVTLAEDAGAAVALATALAFDVVLMDLNLGRSEGGGDGGDTTPGLDAARRILAHPGQQARLYALTADARPEQHDRCRAAGMTGVLVKPLALPHGLGAALTGS
jgi:signal transduction histidine kinase/CheY-like chemotaxis protein